MDVGNWLAPNRPVPGKSECRSDWSGNRTVGSRLARFGDVLGKGLGAAREGKVHLRHLCDLEHFIVYGTKHARCIYSAATNPRTESAPWRTVASMMAVADMANPPALRATVANPDPAVAAPASILAFQSFPPRVRLSGSP